MGKRRQEEMVIGEDSFMDVIANLVGIMIILVVIVGAKGYSTAKVEVEARSNPRSPRNSKNSTTLNPKH
jgi:hypothetical protein